MFTENAIEALTNEGTMIDVQRLEDLNDKKESQLTSLNRNIDAIQKETILLKGSLNDSELLLNTYTTDIQKKMNVIATRDRMLQLSQDRNVYKKKLIYVLLSILIGIFIAIISFYTIYNKNN